MEHLNCGGLSEATLQRTPASPHRAQHAPGSDNMCVSMSRPWGPLLRSLPGWKVGPLTVTMTGVWRLNLSLGPRWLSSFSWQWAWGEGSRRRQCRTVADIRGSRDASARPSERLAPAVKQADSQPCLFCSPEGFAFFVVLLNTPFPCCLLGFSHFKEEIHMGQMFQGSNSSGL